MLVVQDFVLFRQMKAPWDKQALGFQILETKMQNSQSHYCESISQFFIFSQMSTYTSTFVQKRPDVTGDPSQVYDFDNIADFIISKNKSNMISAIGSTNMKTTL